MVIVSRIPGRVRFRDGILMDPDIQSHVRKSLSEDVEISSVIMDIRTGSLLVVYDQGKVSETAVIGRVEEILMSEESRCIDLGLEAELSTQTHASSECSISRRTLLHYGMASTFVMTMWSGFYWNKRAHLYGSILFTLFMAEHMRLHKRILFK